MGRWWAEFILIKQKSTRRGSFSYCILNKVYGRGTKSRITISYLAISEAPRLLDLKCIERRMGFKAKVVEFATETSIHGLKFLLQSSNFNKIAWTFFIVASFYYGALELKETIECKLIFFNNPILVHTYQLYFYNSESHLIL